MFDQHGASGKDYLDWEQEDVELARHGPKVCSLLALATPSLPAA